MIPKLATDRVVAAIDFRDEWENMVEHAAMLARRTGGSLHLVHTVSPPSWLIGKVLPEADLEAQRNEVEVSATRRMERATASLGLDVRTTVVWGKMATGVLQCLADDAAGLLVVGMGEPTGTAVAVGGAADRLLRLSPVPVYACGPRPPKRLESVLVPTALGPAGAAALDVACRLVGPGGRVTALYLAALPTVLPPTGSTTGGSLMALRQLVSDAAQSELSAHVATVRVPEGVTLEPLLRTNLESVAADRTIVKEARERGADLICMALGGRGLAHGMQIGRITERLIRALPCALLGLPDPWIDAAALET